MTKERRMYEDYCNDMNRIAYWLVNNNKIFNVRQVYGYQSREADYETIIKVIKERETKYGTDALITEFVECAIVDNVDHSFLPIMLQEKMVKDFIYLLMWIWLKDVVCGKLNIVVCLFCLFDMKQVLIH